MVPRDRRGTVNWLRLLSRLPWWLGVLGAALAYLGLHRLALRGWASGQVQGTDIEHLVRALAGLGQWLIPGALLAASAVAPYRRRRARYLHRELAADPVGAALGNLGHSDFEALVAEVFRRQGYQVSEALTDPGSGGRALLLTRPEGRAIAQVRHWQAWRVEAAEVLELIAAMTADGAQRGYLVIPGEFSPDARRLAAERPIELIDGPRLRALVHAGQTGPSASPSGILGRCSRRGSTSPIHGVVGRCSTPGAAPGPQGCGTCSECRSNSGRAPSATVPDATLPPPSLESPACPPSLAAGRGFWPGMASIPGAQGAASGTTSSVHGFAPLRGLTSPWGSHAAQAVHRLRLRIPLRPLLRLAGVLLATAAILGGFGWIKSLPDKRLAPPEPPRTAAAAALPQGPTIPFRAPPPTPAAAPPEPPLVPRGPRSVQEMDAAFDAFYIPPPGCANPDSHEAMVTCANDRIRARRGYMAAGTPAELAPEPEPQEVEEGQEEVLAWDNSEAAIDALAPPQPNQPNPADVPAPEAPAQPPEPQKKSPEATYAPYDPKAPWVEP